MFSSRPINSMLQQQGQGGLKNALSLLADDDIENKVVSPMVYTPVKSKPIPTATENKPKATVTTPTKSPRRGGDLARSPLTPVRIHNSPQTSSDENDDEHRRVLRSPSAVKSKKSKQTSNPMKNKRMEDINDQMPEIGSIEDVIKLHQEITENRNKIQDLQEQLTNAQKEKTNIDNERQQLLEKLKKLDETREQAETREKDTKKELVEMEKKLTSTVETLHHEFDRKVSTLNDERHQSDKRSQDTISVLRDQLCQLHAQNESSKKMLEKLEKESQESSTKAECDKKLIEELQTTVQTTTTTNAEVTQTLESTKESLQNVRKDLFFSTCLAIKLNQLMLNAPANVCTQDLWDEAESQKMSSSTFTQFISQKVVLMQQQQQQQQQSPIKKAQSPRKGSTGQANKVASAKGTSTTTANNKNTTTKSKK
ncbi:hypothetical protein SAMD00019534_042650, partial [Acytostelium subglobosum LB1]|uniref:hypothetical protein n=1 Tax=Acytostelium subglobosum LB1 TaxID=1410327 RepID=UPI0006450698